MAASTAGTSHAKSGLPCQDAHGVYVEGTADDEIMLLVCADGAGSASRSDVGSKLACDTIVTEFARCYQQGGRITQVTLETVSEWIACVRSAISTQAFALGVEDRELACTVVCAVLGATSSAFFQIGDGAIVVETDDGTFDVVFWPDSGEYANTTFFVTGVDAIKRLQFKTRDGACRATALLTDGLQPLALKYAAKSAHQPFFAPMFATLRDCAKWDVLNGDLATFLDSASVNARTDDDKTLVLAVCVPDEGADAIARTAS